MTGVAIVDVGPLADGPDPGVGGELIAASHDPGFIYVRNHGVGEGVIAALRHAAWEFFSVDDQTKGRYRVSRHHRGWIAPGGARMADDVPADLKESFVWGSEAERPVPAHSLRGPNRWPHEVPGLPLAAAAWFEEASQLAVRILQAMALALGEPPHHFLSPCERPLSRGSVIRYPPQAAGTRGYGVGPHTDFGTLTVLCQDAPGPDGGRRVDRCTTCGGRARRERRRPALALDGRVPPVGTAPGDQPVAFRPALAGAGVRSRSRDGHRWRLVRSVP